MRKHTEKDDGRKKRRVLKHVEKTSRSKVDQNRCDMDSLIVPPKKEKKRTALPLATCQSSVCFGPGCLLATCWPKAMDM